MSPDDSPQASLVELSVASFLARLGKPEPEPGGGSAAALAGALGAALAEMVAGLALNKPGGGATEQAARLAGTAAQLRDRLAGLIDDDARAYGRVIAAYRLPKNTEEEKRARREAVQVALEGAIGTPMAAAEACLEALRLAGRAAEIASRNTIQDASTAALLAHAGLAASLGNAEANLSGIRDEAFVAEARGRVAELRDAGSAALNAALAAVRRGA